MQDILVVVGTRPEAVKMASVVRALRALPEKFRTTVVLTGQHREMVDPLVAWFDMRPDHRLDLMTRAQSLPALTSRLIASLDDLLEVHRPDWLLAQGDTTTVLAASMAAFYRRVRFGHVEAGLRTATIDRPFPEEFNRRVADLTASACFCPTQRAAEALRSERVPEERIHVTGNTGIDALVETASRTAPPLPAPIQDARRIVLITAHRRESFGTPFECLCRAVAELAAKFSDVLFVYPVHLNPNVQEPVHRLLSGKANVLLLEPLAYPTMVHCLKRATLILTDSGGVQEEAPTFGVPVLVMRDETERPEAVEAGMARLVGVATDNIVSEAESLLRGEGSSWYRPGPNPFGDGQAGVRIAKALAATA